MRVTIAIFVAYGVVFDVALIDLILGSLLFINTYGIVTIFNNIKDVEIDKVNKTKSPLARGQVTKKEITYLLSAYCLVLIALQLWLPQPQTLVFSLLLMLLGWAYSSKMVNIQARGIIAHIVLGFWYVASPFVLAAWYGENVYLDSLDVAVTAAVLILIALPGLLAKDYKDIKGDKQHGKRTPLVRYGADFVRRLATGLALLAVLATFIMDDGKLIGLLVFVAIIYLVTIHLIHSQKATSVLPRIANQASVVALAVFLHL